MVNQPAIDAKIRELDIESWKKEGGIGEIPAELPNVWQEVNGYVTMTKFDFNQGSALFNANEGYPIKAFVHMRTGEVRSFSATMFELLDA